MYACLRPATDPSTAPRWGRSRSPGSLALPLAVGPHAYVFSVLRGCLPGSAAPLYLIDCPGLYERAAIYTTDPDEHLRFLAFTRAVFSACQRLAWGPQILHCHDWHAAFAPLFLRAPTPASRCLPPPAHC